MAVTKSLLKLTETDCVIKIAGTAGSATINLQTDLLRSTEALSGTQTVVISTLTWTGDAAGVIAIDRNSTRVFTLLSSASSQLDLAGQFTTSDNTQSTSSIVVTISGGQAELLLRVKKVSGYSSKIEPSVYGSYDDPTRIGASTTIQGSPDYVAP